MATVECGAAFLCARCGLGVIYPDTTFRVSWHGLKVKLLSIKKKASLPRISAKKPLLAMRSATRKTRFITESISMYLFEANMVSWLYKGRKSFRICKILFDICKLPIIKSHSFFCQRCTFSDNSPIFVSKYSEDNIKWIC